MSTDTTCLVARAMPCVMPASQALKQEVNPDSLCDDLKKLSIKSNGTTTTTLKKEKKSMRTMDAISPADYVTLQSLRSSALARKTNTTSKFARNSAGLFEDLLNVDEANTEPKTEKKTETAEKPVEKSDDKKSEDKDEKKEEKESTSDKSEATEDKPSDEQDGDLLSRGPVRATRTPMAFHPYSANGGYGGAPQTAEDASGYTSYGTYDSAGQSWWHPNHDMLLSNSSTPDTIISDTGYSSATSPQGYYSQNYYQPPACYSNYSNESYSNSVGPVYADQPTVRPKDEVREPERANLTSSDLNRLLATSSDENTELPESLSDFILKYSRRYTSGSEDHEVPVYSKGAYSPESTSSSPVHQYQHRPLSANSGCDSPLSAISAPQTSPAQPYGGVSDPSTPTSDQYRLPYPTTISANGCESPRYAKEALRSLIGEEDMDQAWAWTCKCMMYFPGALSYQDPDKDTLLHIVTKLMDMAKIFTLVERMFKLDSPSHVKMFDMPNRLNETPLFLAVEKRCPEVVEYLLEAGANPNTQTFRHERDAALHYAASRGMTQMINILCRHPRININQQNGMGLTPLLCAVKNHGVLEEESQQIIDSRGVIQSLLAYGADPTIADATSGRTVIHYAVDRMDPVLIDLFKKNLPENTLTALVNQADLCGETPLNILQSMINIDEQQRSSVCLELITSGANASQRNSY
uniref:ANK_REP_REGION domain-containing protein n=1 Tax=Panagrellus redivivus TaxID=6233 RepID=A0A7E4V5S0_PANRE